MSGETRRPQPGDEAGAAGRATGTGRASTLMPRRALTLTAAGQAVFNACPAAPRRVRGVGQSPTVSPVARRKKARIRGPGSFNDYTRKANRA